MEDDNRTFKPDNNADPTGSASPNNLPSTPGFGPNSGLQAPESPATGPASPAPAPAASSGWSSEAVSSTSDSGMAGKLSLLLSSSAIGVFILLIFVTSLVDSLTKAYIWFFIILALGVSGLAFGVKSEKNKENISILGLVGIMVSVIVIINCLIVGSYYIKLQMELNKFESQFNSIDTNLDVNYDGIYQGP